MSENSETWAALPKREKKRRRPGSHGPQGSHPLPATEDGLEGPGDSTTEAGGSDAATSSVPAAARAPNRSEVEARNLARVEEAVEARAAIHRAERDGEDMGADGLPGEFYEYLDHTADVQLHAWGPTLVSALEHLVPCMFNYMTDLNRVTVDEAQAVEFDVEGHDLPSLLFAYLDEFLYRFSTDGFICKRATVTTFDREASKLRVRGQGETFDLEKHPQGTEIKAITYSNMQIHEKPDRTDLYVIVDI